ncbi:MAG: hypothetical protein Kow0042_25500 [Calditrichia bacterium]
MKIDSMNNIQAPSKINYSYHTIKITQSRIEKGLLARPISLKNYFPKTNRKIMIYLDDSEEPQEKNFTPFSSSTRESRIGGLRNWLIQNNIQSGDEVVIQILDQDRYIFRFIPEKKFIAKTSDYQKSFETADNDDLANLNLFNLAKWTRVEQSQVYLNEFIRLIRRSRMRERKVLTKKENRFREKTPNHLRILLENIYKGNCQICHFTFLKKYGKPYYEIHHLNPKMGHHPKNLILVCANCHCQFEYSNVKSVFNQAGRLIEVHFNWKPYQVNQAITDEKSFDFTKFIHS